LTVAFGGGLFPVSVSLPADPADVLIPAIAGCIDMTRIQLSPVVSPKDIGRRPLKSFGRVDIDLVAPDPSQPRCEFSDEAIQQLARSITTKGQLHPIRVRWTDALEKWLIISGERRWRATKAAGLPTIDCYFQTGEASLSEILEQQLVENLLREDLKPMEQAQAFSQLMELNGWNGKQTAEALNISASKVSRSLALLDLPKDIQQRVIDGELAARSAYEVSKIPDDTARRELATKTADEKLTHEQTKAAVIQRKGKPAPKQRGFKQTFFADGGLKVTVTSSKKVTYDEVELAIIQALEEVRHYINQGRTAS
jgi:ParB family chromosome partitioning protein